MRLSADYRVLPLRCLQNSAQHKSARYGFSLSHISHPLASEAEHPPPGEASDCLRPILVPNSRTASRF